MYGSVGLSIRRDGGVEPLPRATHRHPVRHPASKSGSPGGPPEGPPVQDRTPRRWCPRGPQRSAWISRRRRVGSSDRRVAAGRRRRVWLGLREDTCRSQVLGRGLPGLSSSAHDACQRRPGLVDEASRMPPTRGRWPRPGWPGADRVRAGPSGAGMRRGHEVGAEPEPTGTVSQSCTPSPTTLASMASRSCSSSLSGASGTGLNMCTHVMSGWRMP